MLLFVVIRIKITSYGASKNLMEKLMCHFFFLIEISDVNFSLSSYFWNLIFKSDSEQHKELFFSHHLFLPTKNVLIGGARTQKKKLIRHFLTQIETSNVSFSNFSYLRNLFIKSDSGHIKKSISHTFWSYSEKGYCLWRKHTF